jgi:hypothetical protein
MNNPSEEPGPTPVLPLEYASRDPESVRSVLRIVALLFVLWQIHHLAAYVVDLSCYFWEQNDTAVRRKVLQWISLLIRAPTGILSFYLVVNSSAILKLTPAGRRWIRLGALAQAAFVVLANLGVGVETMMQHSLIKYSTAYEVRYYCECFVGASFGLFENLIVYFLFRWNVAS